MKERSRDAAELRRESVVEASAEIERRYGANIFALPEDSIANTRDEIVNGVANRSRNNGNRSGDEPPQSTEPAKNMDHAIGANEKPAVIREHNQAIGKAAAPLERYKRFERGPLQRRVAKFIPRAVPLNQKADVALAQAANAVVENAIGRTHRWAALTRAG